MDAFLAALEAARGVPSTANAIGRLNREFGEEAVAWALTQWRLRKKGEAKFSRAAEMFFTKNGLEQASHEEVARYHASRFPQGVAVADLTCGIGADLLALADRGPAVGFEIDAETAWFARRNVGDKAIVRNEDCLSAQWDFEFAFADPSRRVGSARTLEPSAFSPDPQVLAERFRALKFAGMKLSPMLQDDYLESFGADVEFVSFGGECREALLWFTGQPPSVCARKVETGAVLERSNDVAEHVETPREYLLEADPAAIRAHCLSALCKQLQGSLLGDSNGYLTSDVAASSEWLTTYRVVDFGGFDMKRLRRCLSKLGRGAPIIKSRAVQIDVAALAKKLATPGKSRPVVVLYPVGQSVRFLVAERL